MFSFDFETKMEIYKLIKESIKNIYIIQHSKMAKTADGIDMPYKNKPYYPNLHNNNQYPSNSINKYFPPKQPNKYQIYMTSQTSSSKNSYSYYRPNTTFNAKPSEQNSFNNNSLNQTQKYITSHYPLSAKNEYSRSSLSKSPYYKNSQGKQQQQSPQSTSPSKYMPKTKITNKYFTEYSTLHDKLSSLQGKIAQMRANLDIKRQQNKKFLERQPFEKKTFHNSQAVVQKERNQSVNKFYPKQTAKDKRVHSQPTQNPAQPKPNSSGLNKFITQVHQNNRKQNHYVFQKVVSQVPNNKHHHGALKNPYSPKQNWNYYISEITKSYKDRESLARDHIQSSINILKYLQDHEIPPYRSISDKCVNLKKRPGYENKKTIVFDLDETLVHCNQSLDMPYHEKIFIQLPTGQSTEAGINIRPYAKELLEALHKHFQIIIFTASHSCYANTVIDLLDPERKYVHHRLFRQHCVKTEQGMHVKDLRVINRQMTDILLVDNAAYSYAYQLDNGIPIIPYYEGKVDFQLRALQKYLESMIKVQDVRHINRQKFKLHHYTGYDDVQVLVKELYLWNLK